MDVAYVEWVEDLSSGWVSTGEVRTELDAALASLAPSPTVRPVDREAWLRGAAADQAVMLQIASTARAAG